MSNLGIGELSTGIDSKGMDSYLESLKAELITKTAEKINNITDIQGVIDAGWQGIAKERFMKAFETQREAVITDLGKEYANLLTRLSEVQTEYFQTDMQMLDE